jgi:hypothetical protein
MRKSQKLIVCLLTKHLTHSYFCFSSSLSSHKESFHFRSQRKEIRYFWVKLVGCRVMDDAKRRRWASVTRSLIKDAEEPSKEDQVEAAMFAEDNQ